MIHSFTGTLVGFDFRQDDFSTWEVSIPALGWQRKMECPVVNFPGQELIGLPISGYLVLLFVTAERVEAGKAPDSPRSPDDSGFVGLCVGTRELPEYGAVPVVEAPMPLYLEFDTEEAEQACIAGQYLEVHGTLFFYPTPLWLMQAKEELRRRGWVENAIGDWAREDVRPEEL